MINVEELLSNLDLSPTRKKNLKEKVYYFLSLLTRTNDNYEFLYERDGYKRICSRIQKSILDKDYYTILSLLSESKDPIIEKNKSWRNDPLHGECQGFRLKKKYDTGEVKIKELSKKLAYRIILKSKQGKVEMNEKYKFLIEQFSTNKITIHPNAFSLLRSLYTILYEKANCNDYQILAIKNFIGRSLYYIKKIEEGELWNSVSVNNHRLNSFFTAMPKELRRFILVNGEPLDMIDIKSSQPYILSTILNSKFYLSIQDNTYNLKTIHPLIHNKILEQIQNHNNFYKHFYKINNQATNYKYTTRSHLYMWGEFLNKPELLSLIDYIKFDFSKDFYQSMINNLKPEDYGFTDLADLREAVKNNIMLILFDDNYRNRNNNQYFQIFRKKYPGINSWIERVHSRIGRKEFAYILQRTESYLMLNSVSRRFMTDNPNAPLLTVHDALYTIPGYINKLAETTRSVLFEITGVNSGLKLTAQNLEATTDQKTVDLRWKKIQKINSKKNFENASSSIFESNIKMAEAFLGMSENLENFFFKN
jgi:hypothetical protein